MPARVRRLVLVGQEQLALARPHRDFRFVADPRDGGAQRFGPAGDIEGAVDDRGLLAEMPLQHVPAKVGHARAYR